MEKFLSILLNVLGWTTNLLSLAYHAAITSCGDFLNFMATDQAKMSAAKMYGKFVTLMGVLSFLFILLIGAITLWVAWGLEMAYLKISKVLATPVKRFKDSMLSQLEKINFP